MKTKILFLVIVFSSSFSFARNWQRIEIPGALCGNGEPYSVFIDKRAGDKLLVEFMGGGACWSEGTCYGNSPLTNLAPLPGNPTTSMMASKPSPWVDYTALYFPYCTGDVHAGFHQNSYKQGVQIYHYGALNVQKALQHLQDLNLIPFHDVNDLIVWGYSAGAIGAFLHTQTLAPYFNTNTRKTLIADSPGLHFGKNFWHKFTPELSRDFRSSFGKIDLNYSEDTGLLTPYMGPVFVKLSDWKIGILQSTKDIVMSLVFGDISPEDHKKLVLGPQGIATVAKDYPNTYVWIIDVMTHTFLLRSSTVDQKNSAGESAWEFALRVYEGAAEAPHRRLKKKTPELIGGFLD
ncbi:pectin acetylesterase-family hydrolase [Bdellovibrio sp. 22V]|uniref:pectin acetylesterase-family hydrolase n=1 Tax=Bdellovibrio sp. 22V TaxID=3044166 RepID=UPI0025429E91|nr:pectin acetylesterase-family hydrolase [Bdellovibrio sp. 22V]WII73112.1 pectin acetylesterase-family hydrolase [Bdellovibrio sp. 22V]